MLAQAYGHFSVIRRNPAALDLAQGNCQVALTLNPDLVDAHLAQALIFEYSGNEQGALDAIARALALDPSNPRTLVWQAQIYTRLNRWADAEKTFHRVLKEHPNYWLAYNELGFGLEEQGKYQEAFKAFRAASLAAPRNSLALSNLGGEYLADRRIRRSDGEFEEESCPGSRLRSSRGVYSLALRYQGKYEEALPFARKAVELNPALDTNWLELGDCYSSLRNRHERSEKRLSSRREGGRAAPGNRSGRWPELDAACSLQGQVGKPAGCSFAHGESRIAGSPRHGFAALQSKDIGTPRKT